jgi:hypothetical protein
VVVQTPVREITKVQRWGRPALRLVIPLSVAFLLIKLDDAGWLTALAKNRPGVLPVAMAALLGGLLLSHVRRWLIVTLCFGVSLLALRDSIYPKVPPELDRIYDGIEMKSLYQFGWMLLASLAAVAGAGEALRPGLVWARRCYFGAASLYLSGHGVIGLLRQMNAESLVLLVCGVVALAGVFMAHRIVAAEEEEQGHEDLRALEEQRARRAEQLAAREWRENPEELTKPAGR